MFSKAFIFILFVAFVVSQTVNPSVATLNGNDVNAMRYAVTLENLEANFYNTMQSKFSPSDFDSANLPGVTAATWSIFSLIQAHENAHVNFLNGALQSLGITPPLNCTYNFNSVTTVQQYIQTAALFEAVGVSAYDGAINTIYNSSVATALATIATIEARHAGYLAGLNNSMPVSQSPFDTANPPTTVAGLITPFLTCSYNVTAYLPTSYQVVPVSGHNPADPTSATLSQNDINALNYALFLEHAEADFYTSQQNRFTQDDFARAGYNASVYLNLNLIRDHETAHVNALQQTISGLQGTPVAACVYNWTSLVTDVPSYLTVAATLENTGVSAYDGAINTIYNNALKQTAATIATIEARHASYLNNVSNTNNGPINTPAFDTAILPTNIVTAVTQLGVITSCPNNYQASLPLPQVYRLNAYQNNSSSSSLEAFISFTIFFSAIIAILL